MTDTSALENAVAQRLLQAVPHARDIIVSGNDPGYCILRFDFDGSHHAFRLRRYEGLWHVSEWTKNRELQAPPQQKFPRFETCVANALELTAPIDNRPTIQVKDLRCPADSRRLFGKVILQLRGDKTPPHTTLIEFSCSVCKRETGNVTMHLFDATGQLVRTEAIEPWIKREPRPWFSVPEAATRKEVKN